MSEEMKNTMNEVSAEELEQAAGGASDYRRIVYTVKKGDTLTKIAHRYGVTVDNLVHWNAIKDRNLIVVGQKIVIVK